MGLSVDSTDCLKAWAESLGGITYPLLSDFYPHGQVAQSFGVLRPEGYTERAIFVIDKKGIIRYVDVHDISQQPDNEVLFDALEKVEGKSAVKPQAVSVQARQTPAPAIKAFNTNAAIIMYCTAWCPNCRRARAFLNANGIHYIEVDITRDRVAAERVRQWNNGNETTPTFNINGDIFTGFEEKRLKKILGMK